MAVSKLLKVARDKNAPNAEFANYFDKYTFSFDIPGMATVSWMKLDFGQQTDLACSRNLYLYIAVKGIDVDIPVELYRSAGVAKSEMNTDYSNLIPGATNTLTAVAAAADVSAMDFNITNFIADTLWLKLDVPLLARGTGKIDIGYIITKDKA